MDQIVRTNACWRHDVEKTTENTWSDMRKLVNFSQTTAHEGLRFAPLCLEYVGMIVKTDAAFANAEWIHSQLGYVILLAESGGVGATEGRKRNIVDYGSTRSSRVTRSVLAAERFALVLGLDRAFVAQEMVRLGLGRELPITEVTYSKTAFNCIARLSNTLERRLLVDTYALQESHRLGDLTKISLDPTGRKHQRPTDSPGIGQGE